MYQLVLIKSGTPEDEATMLREANIMGRSVDTLFFCPFFAQASFRPILDTADEGGQKEA